MSRKQRASDPNTPLKEVVMLAAYHPEAVLQNPALSLFFLEDPGWLLKVHDYSVRKLAQVTPAGHPLIDWLLDSDVERLRTHVAVMPHLDAQRLERLVRDSAARVRATVSVHPQLAPAHLELLARDTADSVRHALAKREPLPEDLIETLSRDDNPTVRTAIATRKTLPLSILTRLASDPTSSVINALLGAHRTLPAHLIDVALDAGATPKLIAKLDHTPRGYLEHLARTGTSQERRAVAERGQRLSAATMDALTDTQDGPLAGQLIRSGRLTTEQLATVLRYNTSNSIQVALGTSYAPLGVAVAHATLLTSPLNRMHLDQPGGEHIQTLNSTKR